MAGKRELAEEYGLVQNPTVLEKIVSTEDPLLRSAMIDMARYQGLVDPVEGALLSRHATGAIAGKHLGQLGGGLAGAASGVFLEGGKLAGAIFPEAAKGTMWEHDETSSPLTLRDILARVVAATKGGAGVPYEAVPKSKARTASKG